MAELKTIKPTYQTQVLLALKINGWTCDRTALMRQIREWRQEANPSIAISSVNNAVSTAIRDLKASGTIAQVGNLVISIPHCQSLMNQLSRMAKGDFS